MSKITFRLITGWILVTIAVICIFGLISLVYAFEKMVISILSGGLLTGLLLGGLHLIINKR